MAMGFGVALAVAWLAGTAWAQGKKPLKKCAPDAVIAGRVCMDTWEARVWRVPDPLGANRRCREEAQDEDESGKRFHAHTPRVSGSPGSLREEAIPSGAGSGRAFPHLSAQAAAGDQRQVERRQEAGGGHLADRGELDPLLTTQGVYRV
jgi:hypothetical protein